MELNATSGRTKKLGQMRTALGPGKGLKNRTQARRPAHNSVHAPQVQASSKVTSIEDLTTARRELVAENAARADELARHEFQSDVIQFGISLSAGERKASTNDHADVDFPAAAIGDYEHDAWQRDANFRPSRIKPRLNGVSEFLQGQGLFWEQQDRHSRHRVARHCLLLVAKDAYLMEDSWETMYSAKYMRVLLDHAVHHTYDRRQNLLLLAGAVFVLDEPMTYHELPMFDKPCPSVR
ncbi:hypothetical protein V8E36_006446 [Tilletia maclaganii]